MRLHTRLLARAREGRPGIPFALVVGVAGGLLIANLFGGANASSRDAGASGTAGVAGSGGTAAGGAAAPGAAGGVAGAGTGGAAPGAAGTGATRSGTGGTAAGSGAAAGGGAPAAAGAPASTGAAAGNGGATARGVTATSITVGVAYLDLSGVQYLGPDYNVGDVQKQWNALIDGYHRQHLLPVNGRDITLKFHSFSVLQPAQQRSVCTAMVQDDQVFAVVAPEYFYQYGAECISAEYHTPLITSDGPTDDVYQRGAPFLYTIMPSSNQQLENMVYWARDKGILKSNSVIGVYHLNDPNVQRLVDQSLKGTLAKVGQSVKVEQTTNDANGGPEDSIAVQNFRAQNVDLAIIMTSNIGFMQQASVQHYDPKYIGSDYNGYTTYLQGADYPKDEFNGSYAVTTTDRGLDGAGQGLTPSQQACIDNYNRYSGQNLGRHAGYGTHDTAELVYVLMSCDEGGLMLHALQQAGPQLTPLSFAAGMQTVQNMPMDYFPAVSFGPGKYTGVTQEATIQWEGDCTCWVRRGSTSGLSRPS
jgi:hypothetical protein